MKKLEDETSRDLKKLYRRLLESPAAILSHDLSDTIEGRRRDYGAVTEILCATDNVDKYNIAVFYATSQHPQTYYTDWDLRIWQHSIIFSLIITVFNMTVIEHVTKYKKDDSLYQTALNEYCWVRLKIRNIVRQIWHDKLYLTPYCVTPKAKRQLNKICQVLSSNFLNWKEGQYEGGREKPTFKISNEPFSPDLPLIIE